VLSALTRSAFRGGNITVDANSLEVTDGGQILTTAFSSGDAGNIMVNATHSVTLTGSDPTFLNRLNQFGQVDNDGPASGIFARTEGAGAAGNVTINTPQLTVKDYAQVSASTSGGTGGSISVMANRFEAIDGGQLRTTTAGRSSAGNIEMTILDNVTLAGNDSGLFANTERGSMGEGGDIVITNPKTLVIRDGASVAVDSKGTGEGGNIQIQTGSFSLKKASISAETASNTGGNITLQVQDLLLMRDGSRISTTAGTAQAGGDGGDITIDTDFIVGVPRENSDITANAFTGRGGNINITTQGIYGLQFRPRLTPLSDITASSQFGVNGVVTINTPDVDPSRGLAELPVEPVNVEVAQGCQRGGTQASVAFYNTGRGGLAPNPYEPLTSSGIWEDVPAPTQRTASSASTDSVAALSATSPNKIVEAQGWLMNEKGQVVLVAQMPTSHSQGRCRLR
jgi:large exoprotein involved in heme utilization and adhesion